MPIYTQLNKREGTNMEKPNYSKRLNQILDLDAHDFYSSAVIDELQDMKDKKVFFILGRAYNESLDNALRRFNGVKEPVFQIIKGLVSGLVSVEREMVKGDWHEGKTTVFTLRLPEDQTIILEKLPHMDWGSVYKSSAKWLTPCEIRVIIDSFNKLEWNRSEIEGKKERKRIYDLLERANAPKPGS